MLPIPGLVMPTALHITIVTGTLSGWICDASMHTKLMIIDAL